MSLHFYFILVQNIQLILLYDLHLLKSTPNCTLRMRLLDTEESVAFLLLFAWWKNFSNDCGALLVLGVM